MDLVLEMTIQRLSSKMEKTSEAGGRPATDYQISVDMAKQICMIQRSEKGRQYRQYGVFLRARNRVHKCNVAIKVAKEVVTFLDAKVCIIWECSISDTPSFMLFCIVRVCFVSFWSVP